MATIHAPESVILVYVSEDGERYTQPVTDLIASGTLIDPESGDDMEIVGVITDIDAKLNEVETYADGFGRWHTIIPESENDRKLAMNNIARELNARAQLASPEYVILYLECDMVEVERKDGRVHYAEYTLED